MNKKRIICLILVASVVMTMIPQAVFAAKASDFRKRKTIKANVSMVTKGTTEKDGAGKVLLNRTYQLPVLAEGSGVKASVVKKINSQLQKDYSRFLKSDNYRGIMESYRSKGSIASASNPYIYSVKSRVMYNKNVVSIRYTTTWYAGGVKNVDYSGVTFGLRTGKKKPLSAVMIGSNADIKKKVVNAVDKRVMEEPDLYFDRRDVKNIVQAYKVKDYRYFLIKGKAVICFNTYEIAYGATGSSRIRVSSAYH